MTDKTTNELSDSEKIDWLIRELTMVRAIIEDRFDSVEKGIRSLSRKLEIFNNEMLSMKTDIKDFDERLTELERRPNKT